MHVSVILSTYNSPDWLEKVIWGYSVQSHRSFEIVIADDGSTDKTRQLLEKLRVETGLTIRHVWHEDQGFRKCTILNRAMLSAAFDYLVFSDGDCIPRRDFLAQHVRLARRNSLLSGGYVKLPIELSKAVTREDIVSGRAHDWRWLTSHGLARNLKLLKLAAPQFWATVLDAVTTTRATWNGCNSSAWKVDLMRVNGFDERMEWGGEDRELGERLINAGLKAVQVRHRAVCVHLEHARGYVREEALELNRKIRGSTHRDRHVWTKYGIEKEGGQSSHAA